jgi:NB-ARC domain/WD domain, G-beta repeat
MAGGVGGWRLVPVAVAALVAAVAATVAAVAVNAATSGTAGWYRVVEGHPLWWTAGATVAAAAAGLLAWRVQGWHDRRLAELLPAVQRPEPWVVDRPAEVGQVVAALRRKGGGTVGITTAVQGAGGFGKTTLAKMVGADPRVLRRYRGRVHWVTLGRDAGKEVLPGLVNGLIAQLDPDRPVTFTDVRQAADHLAAVLAWGPRRLLIVDDVWTGQQLAAFPAAGRCARLVTTRIPSLAAEGTAIPVRVDQMTGGQARVLLLHGLAPLPSATVSGLLEQTGGWPLLIRLVSKFLAGQATLQPDISAAAEELLGRLRASGALQVDELTGAARRQLDVGDPDQRNEAVRATIEASTGLLTSAERDRLAELAVFAADETIPVTLITLLWRATGGMDHLSAGALATRLADLALLTPAPGGAVTMHDVIRDYLSGSLGEDRLAQLHAALLDAVAGGLPRAPAVTGEVDVTAWWELPSQARYFRDHLIEHLLAAGRPRDAETVATDLRWTAIRVQQSGPAAPYADLTLTGTPRAERLRRVLGQAAHLLAPTSPPHSLTDILCSRVSHDQDWGPQAQAHSASRELPALTNAWPLPDLPSPAFRLTLTGHTTPVSAVAIAPDGTWLATGSWDGTTRTWDAATGQHRATLTGHTGPVNAVAIAPDGTWLATASGNKAARRTAGNGDHTVRVWDAATGRHRATLTGHTGPVTAVAIAPDGAWLATTGFDGTLRVWNAATGGVSAVMRVDSPLEDCSWNASGRLLAAVGDAGIHLFAFNPTGA